ncbi:helix-turn-helix domain-containing protein [Paenibacillus sacheonensis]|uniref:Helix-turn-helix domain-containing protein n=1 Tax=Paenibacillus sacheonensis TaxID=742054 RepID=A0A7X4YVC1_9BACL|nr:helix-turn-helix domain-containing protein [Paenibacillus sacheonensis]MBM7568003.1 XRE family transcriptional regulator of biofilm formation [Paenibacillus sacheonensis]NBC73210.1 helix-turn-helix domain-containing protein [Paenibacillus sacheonensis]
MIEDIGRRIQQLRMNKGMSLSELAERAEVAKSYVSNVERGLQSNPSIQFLEKVSTALDVTIHAILYGDAAENEQQLDSDWQQLLHEAMSSGISKVQFKEFLEFQKWKKNNDSSS